MGSLKSLGLVGGGVSGHSGDVMDAGTRTHGRTADDGDWRGDFRSWVSRLSPLALADVIDVLARELEARDLGGQPALDEASHRVRAHQAARVHRLVDEFLTR
jgi:hypothetical protein